MARNEIGKKFEEWIEYRFQFDNAKRSKSSGASLKYPIDVTSDNFVIECEATSKKSYSLKLDFWKEVREKAYNSKMPFCAVRFEAIPKPFNLALVDIEDLIELYEYKQAYQELSKQIESDNTTS